MKTIIDKIMRSRKLKILTICKSVLYIVSVCMTLGLASCKHAVKEVKARYSDGSVSLVFEYPDKNDTLSYTLKSYFSDGKLRRQGTVVKGKFTGNIIEYWHSGNVRQVDSLTEPCDVNVQNCDETLIRYNKNGSIAQRFIATNGVLSGLAEQYDSNGILKIAYHLVNDSMKNGEYTQYYNNGHVSVKATYQMGKLVGSEYFFKENGDSLRYFQVDKNGGKSFPVVEWLDNGYIVKGDYLNDKKKAVIWKWYDQNHTEKKRSIVYPTNGGYVRPSF